MDEVMAHVIDGDGVTETPFVREGGRYTNAVAITLQPGAVLDFGGLALVASWAGGVVYELYLEDQEQDDDDD